MTPQDGPSSSLDFAFNASGWTDRADDLPLSYLFAYRRVALTRGTTVDALNASAPLGGYTLDPAPGVYLMCWAVNPQYARDIIVPIGEFVSIGVIAESIFPRTCYLGSASRLSL